MAKTKTEYDLLISCPGDVNSVVKLINGVVKKFNDTYSDVLAIRLNAKHWSNSSYNQSGGKAQELLNKQFIHECDAAIAIFWTRFGAPTDRYGSGTEEEIEDMLAAGKQVFLYFCEKPVDPELLLSDKSRDQYQKVKDYQKKYADEGKGIYASYASDKEFRENLFAHLSMHFLSMKKVEEISNRRTSVLRVKGIADGKLSTDFCVEKFSPAGRRSSVEWINEIRSMYKEISEYVISKPTPAPLNTLALSLQKKVELHEGSVKMIRLMAERLEIDLADDFFTLGGLRESSIATAPIMGGSRNFYGSAEEIEKYNKLVRLFHSIDDFCGWIPFDNVFSALSCIKLAVTNEGTTFDEDIDISLRFKKAELIKPDQIPVLSERGCQSIVDDYNLSQLLGIPETQNYIDFDSSKTPTTSGFHYSPPKAPIDWMYQGRDYEEDYLKELADAFEYSFFEDGDYVIVRLHIDYLKHNTTVAFPTVLFVAESITSIEYTIRSKQNESETVGIIKAGGKNET